MPANWSLAQLPNQLPDQTGRRVLITGANSGIGYPAALELARRGAHVVLACRDRNRGEAALSRLRIELPSASIELLLLDLASLDSVRDAAARELDHNLPLDLLINNAGVMAPPKRRETEDGYELQFGTNVLGHFALTALLLPSLERAAAIPDRPAPRIVTVASIAHKPGRIHFDDLQFTRRYSPMKAYQQSKLADLMFAFELQRRLTAHRSRVLSVAAHPGVARTNLFQSGDYSATELALRKAMGYVIGAALNTDADGAVPTLYAAASPDVTPGGYYGPQGLLEMRGGDAGPAKVSPQANDSEAARKLWNICEELTHTRFF